MAAKNDLIGAGEVDSLFQRPLAEFTQARNALASALKKAGRAEAAAQIKSLQKPSVSAWVVNQLHWRHPRDLATLLEAGDRFREAQKAQLAGKSADMRGTLEARRKALTEATNRAADLLREAGHPATPDLMRRVQTTLETLAAYGTSLNGPGAGRLVDDVEPAGFEALATLIPANGSKGSSGAAPRIIPFTQKQRPHKPAKPKNEEEAQRQREAAEAARRAEARRAVQAAEETLRGSRTAARAAEAALKKAAPRAKAAERLRAQAEKRFEQLSRKADEMTKEARRVAQAAEEAAQALSEAEAALARAKQLAAGD
jgi:hypothetical protein